MNQEQITNIWEQLYKNKNTELQFDDFKEYMYSILGVDKNYDDDIMILFKLADRGSLFKDKSKDEKIGKREFEKFMRKIPENKENKERMFAELFFQMIDWNSDGTTSKEEFKKFWNVAKPDHLDELIKKDKEERKMKRNTIQQIQSKETIQTSQQRYSFQMNQSRHSTQQNNDNLDEKWIEYIIQFGENNVIDSLYKIIVNEILMR